MSDAAFAARIGAVQDRVDAAARRAGRTPSEIALVGVSKRKPAELVVDGVRAGLTHIGENYVQEALAKLPAIRAGLADADATVPRFHFIGQLQRNKAKAVAQHFDAVHTVDRVALGDALDRHAAAAERPLDALLQVDLDDEPQKGGAPPDALPALLEASRAWSALRVTGLMAIPAPQPDPDAMRPRFAALRTLRDRLRDRPGGEALAELSMGMSADFEVAIEEGATIIRVGTALFGARETGEST